MDNAPIHRAKILKTMFSYLNIMYGAAYSPFLNPIEEFFANIKNKIRFIPKTNRADLIKGVYKAFKMVKNDDIFSFHLHSL
jgi:transposase